MNADNIEYLLRELFCTNVKRAQDWVVAACPFAPWKHKSGTDRRPSFCVSIVPDSRSIYTCHACQAKGDLHWLVTELETRRKVKLPRLVNFVILNNKISPADYQASMERAKQKLGWGAAPIPTVMGIKAPPGKIAASQVKEPVVLDESELEPLRGLPDHVLEYLTGPQRRLSLQSIREWELGWHEGRERVVIPIRDENRILRGISGRAFHDGVKPKYMHSTGYQRDLFLYGEHLAVKGKPVCLVEGFFDAIYLRQCGYNAVAFLGSHLSWIQAEKLIKYYPFVMVVPDGDKPGYDAGNRIVKLLEGRCPRVLAKMPMGKDPDQLEQEEMLTILGEPKLNSVIDVTVSHD